MELLTSDATVANLMRNCIHQPVFSDKDRAGIKLGEKTECLDKYFRQIPLILGIVEIMRKELSMILDKRLNFHEHDLLKNAGNRYEPTYIMKGRGEEDPAMD